MYFDFINSYMHLSGCCQKKVKSQNVLNVVFISYLALTCLKMIDTCLKMLQLGFRIFIIRKTLYKRFYYYNDRATNSILNIVKNWSCLFWKERIVLKEKHLSLKRRSIEIIFHNQCWINNSKVLIDKSKNNYEESKW